MQVAVGITHQRGETGVAGGGAGIHRALGTDRLAPTVQVANTAHVVLEIGEGVAAEFRLHRERVAGTKGVAQLARGDLVGDTDGALDDLFEQGALAGVEFAALARARYRSQEIAAGRQPGVQGLVGHGVDIDRYAPQVLHPARI